MDDPVMQHSPGRDREGPDVAAAFADPAFAEFKGRGVPFAILRPEDGAVLWANAAAAEHWEAGDAADLARILFGPDGQGGWLDGLTRGLVPGRGPRLARGGLARGLAMRVRTALIRAWTAPDGGTVIGLAVPDASAGLATDADAWRRSAWAQEPAGPAAPDPDADAAVEPAEEPGPVLARRGHLAVLRDRLSRALDGAAALRLLWRTDAAGLLVAYDADVLARMGSPLRPGGHAWPDAVEPFDPAGAGRLRAALASRATWSGVSIALPVAEGAASVPMALSGSPVFGPERSFAGFRGFGTLDLGDLSPAARGAPGPAAGDDAEVAGEAAAPPDPAGPAVPADAPEEPRPAEADAGPMPANVVPFRAVQGAVPGRTGPVTPPGADRGLPVDGAAEASPEGGQGTEPDGKLEDRLAFLALGEALRARIGAASEGAEATEAERPAAEALEPAPAPPADETASPLLDRLPVPVLISRDGRAVYVNAAAAARLGPGGPQAVAVPEAGRVALTGEGGRTVSAAAWGIAVPWGGAPATLWLLSESEPEVVASAVPDPVEPPADRPPRDDGDGGAADLLDRVDDAVALLDAAGRVRRLNRRGEGWFGDAGTGTVLGRPFADLLAPESRPAVLALLAEVRDQRDGIGAPPLRREVAARAGEGAPVPMLLTLGRLGASGFYATLRDETSLRRAETDRARTERDHARTAGRLPDLLAKVSHEIRTPLGAILGFAEVMMDERLGPLGNPRYRDYLKDIHASGTQVVALVDDLLDLSRIEAGQVELTVAALDVNRVVAETVAQMQPEAHRDRVIMRTSLAGRIPAALADERSARQIVRNLLSNAVKFNEPGGQVIVSTALGEAGAVLLRVRDTGVGMSDEEIAAALEPFGGLPAHAAAGGNGLGLPLTRALVGANGASMTVRSRPGEGTLVEVAFVPADPGQARLPA